jgi:hypothetical protein
MKAKAELASLYRERAIARAWAARRDPKKKEPPVPAARSVKQGGVQEDGWTPPLMI